jgi:hypothetical protein
MSDDFGPIHTTREIPRHLSPEFAHIRTVSAIFGLSRTEIFTLIADKKIRSILYKSKTATKNGKRLVDLSSVREYLRSLL